MYENFNTLYSLHWSTVHVTIHWTLANIYNRYPHHYSNTSNSSKLRTTPSISLEHHKAWS